MSHLRTRGPTRHALLSSAPVAGAVTVADPGFVPPDAACAVEVTAISEHEMATLLQMVAANLRSFTSCPLLADGRCFGGIPLPECAASISVNNRPLALSTWPRRNAVRVPSPWGESARFPPIGPGSG